MTDLKEKVTSVLQESRMLILGSQILLGFQYHAVFHPVFAQLPAYVRWLDAIALLLILLTLALLMASTPFHRIVEGGESTQRIHAYGSALLTIALFPFALAIAIDVYIAATRIIPDGQPALAAGMAGLLALALWYALPKFLKARQEVPMAKPSPSKKVALKDKIEQMLTEARVVLPGAQALLGFQFAAVLTESFDKLPAASKYAHGASLGFIALAVILLMSPAPYHRIVANGEDREDVDRFGVRVVLGAMLPLALGFVLDAYVVLMKISGSMATSAAVAAAAFLGFVGLWYGVPLFARSRQ